MTDKYLRAAGGDRWLAAQLRLAVRLCADGKPLQPVNLGDGAYYAACYVVRLYGLDV